MITFQRLPLIVAIVVSTSLPVFAMAPPSHTATIVVRGFDKNGASSHGVFGADVNEETVTELAATVGLPTADVAPYACLLYTSDAADER
ncbi:MAG: hypothetical protein N2Z21_07050, partial [Candidatus Sumerlaeaceae bacterium]|nr:hypothetical protein [Candidatus Sumerlaeaceae bacterium]